MTVNINLDLDASGVIDDIAAVKTALESLDEDVDGIKLDDVIDADGLTEEFDDLFDSLDELEDKTKRITDNLESNFSVDIPEQVTVTQESPDGDTGDGDSVGDDPPDGDGGDSSGAKSSPARKKGRRAFSVDQLKDKISFDTGVDKDKIQINSDFDLDKLRSSSFRNDYLDFERDSDSSDIGIKGKTFSLEKAIRNDVLKPAEADFFDNAGFDPDGFFMDEEKIKSRLASQDFTGRGATVDTDTHGKVSPETARDRKRGFTAGLKETSTSELFGDDLSGHGSRYEAVDIDTEPVNFDDSDIDADFGEFANFQELFDNEDFSFESVLDGKDLRIDKLETDAQDELFQRAGIDESERFSKLGGKKQRFSEFSKDQQKRMRRVLDDVFDEDIAVGTDGEILNDLDRDTSGFSGGRYGGDGFSYQRRGRTDSELLKSNPFKRKHTGRFAKSMKRLQKIEKKVGKHLRKLVPSMSMFYSAIAAVIPIAIALGTVLLGVASAMLAVAAAGVAIAGFGLLGHGETMQESFDQAKKSLNELKKELFQSAQPMMQQFAPIQDRMFDAIPDAMDGVFESMEGLTVFEDTLFQLGNMLAGGMQKAIDAIVANEDAISQLVLRFSQLAGSAIFDFFSFLLREATKNQNVLTQLGADMLNFIKAVYNLSLALSVIISTFSPLFEIILIISEILKNDLIAGIVSMAGWLYVLGKAALSIWALGSAFMGLAGYVQYAIAMIIGYEISIWSAVAATLALVAAVAMLTLGMSAIMGGIIGGTSLTGSDMSGGGGGMGGGMGSVGGGSKTVYNDNRTYNVQPASGNDLASRKARQEEWSTFSDEDKATNPPT